MSDLLLQDLKEQILSRQVVVVVGTGVSINVTNNSPCASWQGLLHSGVDRCKAVVSGLPDRWDVRAHEEIDSSDLGELLSAAEKVSEKLGAPDGGEYRRWLRETVGALTPVKTDVIQALDALGVALCTTNYDDLIEKITQLESVTGWMEQPSSVSYAAMIARCCTFTEFGNNLTQSSWGSVLTNRYSGMSTRKTFYVLCRR